MSDSSWLFVVPNLMGQAGLAFMKISRRGSTLTCRLIPRWFCLIPNPFDRYFDSVSSQALWSWNASAGLQVYLATFGVEFVAPPPRADVNQIGCGSVDWGRWFYTFRLNHDRRGILSYLRSQVWCCLENIEPELAIQKICNSHDKLP